jgi:hypothetical protein
MRPYIQDRKRLDVFSNLAGYAIDPLMVFVLKQNNVKPHLGENWHEVKSDRDPKEGPDTSDTPNPRKREVTFKKEQDPDHHYMVVSKGISHVGDLRSNEWSGIIRPPNVIP